MPPHSALTRFIKQGLMRGVCPLCRVVYKVDGEYMWAFLNDYSHEDAVLDRLRRSRGFCAAHAGRLRRLEVEGLGSNLGISGVYLDTLRGLQEELEGRALAAELPQPNKCPACQYRDEEVERNARYLIEEIISNLRSRELFLTGNGICFPHLQLVWEQARNESEREILLSVQRRVLSELIADLEENIRKQGHEYDGEPTEREAASWARAIQVTAGWPKESLRDPLPAPEDRYRPPDFSQTDAQRGIGK
jgi:hypothetical protein